MKHRALAVIVTAALALAGSATFVTPAYAEPGATIRQAGSPDAVPGRYIVVLKDAAAVATQSSVGGKADELVTKFGGRTNHIYHSVLRGFSASMSEKQASRLAADPNVAYVEQVQRMTILDTQNNPPNWGDDRIDQRNLPLNQQYNYPTNAGQGATVYVLDTGINANHSDFTGRIQPGYDFVDRDSTPQDCQGHGTHVAGTAAGTTYGVAKKAKIVAVRVLNCQGSGTNDNIIAGINWVRANAQKPAVVNYSIGCQSRCTSTTMDNAVKNLIASGVQFVQAAGNSSDNSCYYSPQAVPEAVTVGNTTSSDAKNSSSNYGSCLDLFAPGTSIVSASHSSNTGSATMTGTSMASPHVAGAAALYLGANPNATPAQVRDALVNNGTTGKVTSAGTGSPNVLLYTGFIGGDPGPGSPSVSNPGNQSSQVNVAVDLQLSASGGTTPYSWSASGLPAGLTIGSSTGRITGSASSAGTYNVTVTVTDAASQTGSASFTWTVTTSGGTCSGHEFTVTGTLSSGASQYQPNGSYYYSAWSGSHTACLVGPSGTDFDLYLQKWNGYSWVNVASGTTPSNSESISYTGTAGYYRYRVHAYSGSGSYTLGYTNP